MCNNEAKDELRPCCIPVGAFGDETCRQNTYSPFVFGLLLDRSPIKAGFANGFIDCWFLSFISNWSMSHLYLMILCLNLNLSSLNKWHVQMGSNRRIGILTVLKNDNTEEL